MNRYKLLDVQLDDIAPKALRELLTSWVAEGKGKMIVTPNPEFVLEARRDPYFRTLLNTADLALPDGVGLRFALAALSDNRLSYRHTGADTLVLLAELCRDAGKRLVLLGGVPKKTQRAAESLVERFSGLDVHTFDPGIIDNDEPRLSEATLAGLERLSPHVIGVALGHGKQEKVMEIIKNKLFNTHVLIGMGGASDYVSMAAKRAPLNWQRWGFEWLWRLIHEPWRYKRICKAVVLFPLTVAWATLRSGRFLTGTKNVLQELRTHVLESRDIRHKTQKAV